MRRRSVERVAARHIAKKKKIEKSKGPKDKTSLNVRIDQKFKAWKGKNPNTGKEVGYYTVKGWKMLSKKSLSKSPEKKKLKEYALKVFEKFKDAVQEDGGASSSNSDDAQTKEILESITQMSSKPNMGLPKEVFDGNKLALQVEKPTKEDVEKIAEGLKDHFNTTDLRRGVVGQNLAAFISDEYTRRTVVMVKEVASTALSIFGSGETAEERQEALESNPEVRAMAGNLAVHWTQSTFGPMALGLAGIKVTGLTSAIGASLASAVGAGAVAGAPLIASMAVGSIAYKFLLHGRSAKRETKDGETVRGVFNNKHKGLPDSYDNLAADIYTGYATPESVEAEYKKKLDKILKDEDLSPEKMREEVLALYEDFDTNARPSIDKGLLLLGQTDKGGKELKEHLKAKGFKKSDPTTWGKVFSGAWEYGSEKWSDSTSFLKQGAKSEPPVLVQLMKLKDQYEAQDQFIKAIEDDPEWFAEEIRKTLCGEVEIPKEIAEGLSGDYSGSSKKSSRDVMVTRIASRYMHN